MLTETELADLGARVERLRLGAIRAVNPTLADKDIAVVTSLVGTALPPDFLWFATTIGRSLLPIGARVPVGPNEWVMLDVLFGGNDADSEIDTDSLQWNLESYAHFLMPGELIVGQNLMGHRFVLNARSGGVHFLDPASGESVALGVDSYGEFLNLIDVDAED